MTQAERQRRRRARARRCEVVAPVAVGPSILDALIELHWLAECEAASRDKIGDAITAMLTDLARHR